jgi:L-serine dehydratase
MSRVAAPPATISVFELFTIGIGPSSSHTVGPMRAARRFARALGAERLLESTDRVAVELFGSLGATASGHGTPTAVMLGLLGEEPETVDPDRVPDRVREIGGSGRLALLGRRTIAFGERDIALRGRERLPGHPNALRLTATDARGAELSRRTYRSLGGGFISEDGVDAPPDRVTPPYPFATAEQLLAHCLRDTKRISDVMLANECARRSEDAVRSGLLDIWRAMQECVRRGCTATGTLPGGLDVPRRAAALLRRLQVDNPGDDPLRAVDWIQLYALAVNEENAGGGRVVTAPTNGAAGIVPAVLHYYRDFVDGMNEDGVIRFLLVAGAIGSLYKRNASISGAEVGCQGEVGSASSMAAAGLAEVLGGTAAQVETAAEIAMEHNLGLTCDPVAGLVQIPCIERNALAAVKAVAATRLALRGDGTHHVSLDTVIRTMRETGAEMSHKYKETSEGGLAVNVPEC